MDVRVPEDSMPAGDPWARAEQLGALVRRIDDPGPGRPLVVKEILGVRGVPRTASSGADLAPVPAEDSGPVAPLRAAGWAPVAVSRTHEHAWGITTRTDDGRGTLNPHDATRIPGGSSGGSAVAVAIGLCAVALGSDTAGSIRIPAAFCGVLGIKPTWGVVDMTGCQALAPSLDTPGLLCSDVDSAAEAMRAWGLATTHAGRLRWGVAVDGDLPAVRPDIARVLDEAVNNVAVAQEVRLPSQQLLEVFRGVQPREALAVHRDVLGTWPARRDDYGPGVASRLRAAERLPPDDTLAERRVRVRDELLTAMADVEVLALPVAACGPTPIDAPDFVTVDGRAVPLRDLVLPFTVPASLCGLPAASVPVGVDEDGLPVGLQLVAHPHGEGALVEAVRAVTAWVDARR